MRGILARYAGKTLDSYKYAVIDELTDRDPTQNVTRPKVTKASSSASGCPPSTRSRCLTPRVKAGPREHVFVVLLGQMALRVGEMCVLNADSVRYYQGKNGLDRAAVLPYASAQYGMLNTD